MAVPLAALMVALAVEPVVPTTTPGAAGSLVLRPRVFFWLLALSCGRDRVRWPVPLAAYHPIPSRR